MTSAVGVTVASGPLLLAVPLAVLAGLLSFFSPCVVPLLPGYLSYVTGIGVQDLEASRRGRLVLGALLFVAGFTVVFVAGGALFGFVSAQLREQQRLFSIVMGVVVIALGIVFAGVPGPWQREVKVHAVPAVGLGVAPLLGALFGLGWVPCISPTLIAVLSLSTTDGTAVRGAVLSLFYSVGLGLPFVLAALALARFGTTLGWVRRHQRGLMRSGGAVLVVVGVLLVTGLWDSIVSELQTSLGNGAIAL